MKAGALVELIDDNWAAGTSHEAYPVKDKIYTIRQIRHAPTDYYGVTILLEEITNPSNALGIEYGFIMRRFREIHYNASAISELLEETKTTIV